MVLEKVEFVFENCERITIEGKYISDFYLGDIYTEFARIACNSIEKLDMVKTVAIGIHKGAEDKEYAPFGEKDWKKSNFQRFLQYNDITHICFIMDGEKYSYSVEWNEDDAWDQENSRQTCYLSRLGHLYIVVSDNPEEDLKTKYFPYEDINSKEYIDFHMDICDVGRDISYE